MNKLSKNIFYAITIGLSVVFVGLILFASKGNEGTSVSMGLVLMYILFIIAILTALILAIKGLVNNPKSAKFSFIGLVALLVMVLIGYFTDNHQVKDNYKEFGVSSESMSGLIGGSLIATWIILFGAVALTLFASVKDFIKKL